MKTFIRKTTAAIMSVLIVLGFFAFGSSAVVASAESVNHYEYSYDYLKAYLKNYGNSTEESKYVSKTVYGSEYIYFFTITYFVTYNTLYFSFTVRDLETEEKLDFITLDLPYNDSNTLTYYANDLEYGVIGNAVIYPASYNLGDSLDYILTNNSGVPISNSAATDYFNSALKFAIPYWNELLNSKTGLTLGNFKFTKLYPENTSIYPSDNTKYTVTFNTLGHGTAPESQTVSKGGLVNNPGDLTAEGYRFRGWYKDRDTNEKWDFSKDTVQSNITLYAGWVKVNTPASGVTINVKSSATVDYRANVTLNATATGITDNSCMLAIYEGASLKRTGNNMQVSYNIGEMTSGRTFTVKAIDSNGNSLKDASGAEISKTVEIKVKNSFFDILIAFFKGLFGMLPNVEI